MIDNRLALTTDRQEENLYNNDESLREPYELDAYALAVFPH
jgi:hypothetical protein